MDEHSRSNGERTADFNAFVTMIPPGRPPHVRLLAEEYARRHSRNTRYSLRAFAKSLGLHPSALSRIMTGKQTLSLTACPKVVASLGLPQPAQRAFLGSLVDERVRIMEQRLSELMGGAGRDDASASEVPVDVASTGSSAH